MQKMTSAYANKLLKQLEDEKLFWLKKEASSSTYIAAVNEEPVVPSYDYSQVADKICEVDRKIAAIKHAINLSNATMELDVSGCKMSVDTILIKMAQLNRRKAILDSLRKNEPKERQNEYSFRAKSMVPEYKYINYDLDTVKRDFEKVSNEIMQMQIALDYHNQVVQFDVDI